MGEFTVTVIRIAFFALLWLFIFGVAGVLRRDLFGARAGRGGRSSARANRTERRSEAPQAQAASAGASYTATLILTSGSQSGMRLALSPDSPITIGRSGDCGLVLEDDFASGRHARLHADGSGWILEDLGSTNGTFVGDQRITGAVRISPGTRITVGHTNMELAE